MTPSPTPPDEGMTRLLHGLRDGDPGALDRLFPAVYDELRRIAEWQMRRERAGHTLDATALVHEAYLRLAAGADLRPSDRAHFLGIAARTMRQVLVDHARRQGAAKRGGGWRRTTIVGKALPAELDPETLLALDQALEGLEERQRRIVEMRFFAGLEETEIAAALGVSTRTVQRDWLRARAWIYQELYPTPG